MAYQEESVSNGVSTETAPARNPMDVLMQVEVPVSVSLGRTRMRMKDLLGLTQGSVVELDEYVGDEVEILVNKRVLAHGEVVAVDGYYGVRITRMGGSAQPASPVIEAAEES
jgi:flagellar motor switch protein FliN/FliY